MLSAAPAQARPTQVEALRGKSCGTIEGRATATLAWLARIRSSLLLKTASLRPGSANYAWTGCFPRLQMSAFRLRPLEPWLYQQYTAMPAARQRYECGAAQPVLAPNAIRWPLTADS